MGDASRHDGTLPGIVLMLERCADWMRLCRRYLSSVALLAVLWVIPGAQCEPIQYSATTWRNTPGLPENLVRAMHTDRSGNLWVATGGGLVSFDGSQFTPLGVGRDSVFVNSFWCLLRASDGSMWAGMEGGGILHVNNGVLTRYGSQDGLTNGYVRSLFEDSSKHLWATTDAGLFVQRGSRFERIELNPKSSQQLTDTFAIAEIGQNHLLVAGTQMFDLKNGQSTRVHLPGIDSLNAVKGILQDASGAIWVGTHSGLYRLRGKRFEHVPGISGDVSALLQDRDQSIWVGSGQSGLWRLDHGHLSRIEEDGQNAISSVKSLFQDEDGRIWVGTLRGLVRLVRTQAVQVVVPGGPREVGSITFAPDGGALLAAHKVFRLTDPHHPTLNVVGMREPNVVNVLYGRDGTRWVGTLGNGVFHVTSRGTTHYASSTTPAIAGDFSRGLLETSDGDIWIATGFGLSRIRKADVRNFGTSDGLPSRNIRSFLEDENHCLWVGTEAGAAHICSDRVIQDAITARLANEKIWTILRDAHGTVWFATRDNGIYVASGTGLRHITTSDGLLSDSTYGFVQDHQNNFWLTTPAGIAHVTQAEVDRFLADKTAMLPMYPVALPYEAEGAIGPGDRFPMTAVAPDGTVWIAYDRGAIHITGTAGEQTHRLDMKGSVTVDGIDRGAGSVDSLAGDTQSLSFSFPLVYLDSQSNVDVRYRLSGYDPAWRMAPPSRTVEYRHLAPGNYEFQARAFLRNDPEKAVLFTVPFHKRQLWYRTLLFDLCCLLAVMLIAALLYALRLRRLRYGFGILLEERSRLAREMHDTLIQGCNGVATLLEVLAVREGPKSNNDLLQMARTQILDTMSEAREAVWNLRNGDVDGSEFLSMLRSFTTQATEALDTPVTLTNGSTLPTISGSAAHELLMIAREAIANAANHGKAAHIGVSTSFGAGVLSVAVMDDGCGFDMPQQPDPLGEHYGLRGMKERAEKIGAVLTVVSNPHAGTSIAVKMPVSRPGNHAARGFAHGT